MHDFIKKLPSEWQVVVLFVTIVWIIIEGVGELGQAQPAYDLAFSLVPSITSIVTTAANLLAALEALKSPRHFVAPSAATPPPSPALVFAPLVFANMLRAGVPADIRDAAGNTRLHIAAAGDRDAVAVARVLLAAGADGDARNCARKTPRELALVAGNFDLLAVLAEWDGERRRARRGRLR